MLRKSDCHRDCECSAGLYIWYEWMKEFFAWKMESEQCTSKVIVNSQTFILLFWGILVNHNRPHIWVVLGMKRTARLANRLIELLKPLDWMRWDLTNVYVQLNQCSDRSWNSEWSFSHVIDRRRPIIDFLNRKLSTSSQTAKVNCPNFSVWDIQVVHSSAHQGDSTEGRSFGLEHGWLTKGALEIDTLLRSNRFRKSDGTIPRRFRVTEINIRFHKYKI
jgi:hypothetical protein